MFFKRAAMRLTAGILTISTLASPALAVAGVTNTGSSKLNLRAQAATSSAVLTKIPGSSTVEVLSTDTAGWYQVTFDGKTGYVSSQYVDLAEDSAPAVDAPAVETPAPEAPVVIRGRITDGPLNVRSGPSTPHSKCGRLNAGTEIEVLEKLDGWYRTPQGYVSAEFVSLITAESYTAPPTVEAPAETAPPTAEAPAETAVPTETAPAGETIYARVTVSSLNLRSGPSTSHDKCGKLRAGKIMEVLEKLDGWYRVEGGYISADYVTLVDESALTASSTADQVVDLALTYLGSPYVYGGSSPKGFDCSGFTSYLYKQFGISLNRTCSGQLDNGTPVSMSELLPGDLVIFKKYANSSQRASHVGLYIGDGKFIHASTYGVGVIINRLSDAYYTTGFVGGRRIV